MLSDKVLDSKCQLYYNHEGPHRNNIYGDINMVNGQPWPNMPLAAGWMRFRFLNAAMVRPYLIKIKDSKGADVAQDICHVIAADGGYRARSVPFPVEGLQIGVSERYEVVCNFESFAGQTLYLW
jgi:FtsP/CotA-like multicopper oxidase with cupredoxin domain